MPDFRASKLLFWMTCCGHPEGAPAPDVPNPRARGRNQTGNENALVLGLYRAGRNAAAGTWAKTGAEPELGLGRGQGWDQGSAGAVAGAAALLGQNRIGAWAPLAPRSPNEPSPPVLGLMTLLHTIYKRTDVNQ